MKKLIDDNNNSRGVASIETFEQLVDSTKALGDVVAGMKPDVENNSEFVARHENEISSLQTSKQDNIVTGDGLSFDGNVLNATQNIEDVTADFTIQFKSQEKNQDAYSFFKLGHIIFFNIRVQSRFSDGDIGMVTNRFHLLDSKTGTSEIAIFRPGGNAMKLENSSDHEWKCYNSGSGWSLLGGTESLFGQGFMLVQE